MITENVVETKAFVYQFPQAESKLNELEKVSGVNANRIIGEMFSDSIKKALKKGVATGEAGSYLGESFFAFGFCPKRNGKKYLYMAIAKNGEAEAEEVMAALVIGVKREFPKKGLKLERAFRHIIQMMEDKGE